MFKQRLITTLVLIPLVLWVLYFAPSWLLVGALTLLVAGFYWESMPLVPVVTLAGKSLLALGLLVLIWLSWHWLGVFLAFELVLWIFISWAICSYPQSQRMFGYASIVGVVLNILFAGLVSSLAYLYTATAGQSLILYVLCIVWATDIGAYLVGKSWGRTKLIVHVSPGKSVEGAVGGVILALIVMVIGYFYFHPSCALSWFVIGLGTVVMAMMGDLFISMLKRRCQIKDTGTLFPGHGGLLDRLDSVIAAVPFFVFFYERWMCSWSWM